MFLSVIINSVSQRLPLKAVMGAGSKLPKCFGGKYCTEILAMISCPSLEVAGLEYVRCAGSDELGVTVMYGVPELPLSFGGI